MNTRDRRSRLILADAIREAEAYEKVARVDRSDPLQIVIIGMLIRQRSLATALQQLRAGHAPGAIPVVRAMLETWINLEWICCRDSKRRANRFIKFEAVARVRHFEHFSKAEQTAAWKEAHAAAIRERRKVRHLFRWRNRKGKLRWRENFSNINLAERVNEVIRIQRIESSDAYNYYRLFSAHQHGDVTMYPRLAITPNGRVLSRPAYDVPISILNQYATSLITEAARAANKYIDPLYESAFQKIRDRADKLDGDLPSDHNP